MNFIRYLLLWIYSAMYISKDIGSVAPLPRRSKAGLTTEIDGRGRARVGNGRSRFGRERGGRAKAPGACRSSRWSISGDPRFTGNARGNSPGTGNRSRIQSADASTPGSVEPGLVARSTCNRHTSLGVRIEPDVTSRNCRCAGWAAARTGVRSRPSFAGGRLFLTLSGIHAFELPQAAGGFLAESAGRADVRGGAEIGGLRHLVRCVFLRCRRGSVRFCHPVQFGAL